MATTYSPDQNNQLPPLASATQSTEETSAKGASGLLVAAIIFLLLVVGALLYLLYTTNQRLQTALADNSVVPTVDLTTTVTPTQDPYAGWESYTRTYYEAHPNGAITNLKISFQYPTDWDLEDDVDEKGRGLTTVMSGNGYGFTAEIPYGGDSSSCIFSDTSETDREAIKRDPLGYFDIDDFTEVSPNLRRGIATVSGDASEEVYIYCLIDETKKYGTNIGLSYSWGYKVPAGDTVDEDTLQILDLIIMSYSEEDLSELN